MPFQKGYKKNPPQQNDVVNANPFEDVSEEMQPSALLRDEIVPKAPETPKSVQKEEVIPQVDADEEPDFSGIHGWNLAEMEFIDINLNKTPRPPKCVQEWCKKRDLVWRWLSYPGVKHFGMRGFVALSMTPELRKKIKQGDCPPTIDIDVSNKLVWREDAFLGIIPKKLHEARKKAKAQRIIDQNKLAKLAPGGLQELARRAGGKLVEYSVEETSRQGL